MSTFALLKADAVEEGVQALERDLSSQTWHRRYADLLELSELDVGYRIVRAEFA
jgi:hypothetical protein